MTDDEDIISWTTIKIGCISGFTLASAAVLYGLVTANAFSVNEFVESSLIIGTQSMVVAIVLVVIGGYYALMVKNLLRNFNR